MSKPGRNDSCPCGSGKKYKQCCMLKETNHAPEPPTIPALLQAGLSHHQAGRLAQAESFYRQILQREPQHADALHLLGVIAYQVQQYDAAAQLIEQAIAANPNNPAYHVNLGSVRQDQGRVEAAIGHYRQALVLQPDYPEAHNNLGNALLARGENEAAIESYLNALRYRGDYAQAHNNLGNARQACGQLEQAIACFKTALAYQPDYAEAHNNLGNALQAQHQPDEALVHYRRALALNPQFAKAFINLGNALQERGELAAAIEYYQQGLALNPELAEAHNNLANALKAQQHDAAALVSYQRALELKPDYAEAYFNMANVHREGGNTAAAITLYQQAIALKPGFAEAYNGLGNAQQDLGCFDIGRASLETSLRLKPDFDVARSNLLFNLNYDTNSSPADYFAMACRFGEHVAAQARSYTAWFTDGGTEAGQPLRIGLVSGDLRMHPVGYFLESVVAHLDPQQVELLAFVTKAHEDALTTRIKPRFAGWHSLIGLDDAAAARLIHQTGVHLLLDLAGHSADNRLPVFAWKPAPVQAAWLGYFASTGVAAIDYIVADRQVLPASEAQYFVEQPWYLPDCYLCFTPPQIDLAVGHLPLLHNGYVTFGCFNKLSKINHEVVALWSRVLHAVPDSRLILKAKELNEIGLQRSTIERFVAHGIAAQRIVVEGSSPRADYLDCYNRVDIALDPFPYPGGTTTVEALWMGVPVLTRRGDRFLSHAGESLLQTAGLGEWVARDNDEYVLKASTLAADRRKLTLLRAGLRQRLLASPLCDAPRFAAHLQDAFKGMWQHHMARATEPADE